MGSEKTSLFPLPKTRVIETVYVQLPDGRIVARSVEELVELAPDAPAPQVIARSNS